ncbi:aminotransferase class V-fold PLP-dependent enzyme [Streptomyces sp. NPDC051940]|uniref:aminotransferase class V-fold PLP-dependent enzyme n=1 Tax=Streptomyces sp. NPDC051940 TaxID=3155675 RepID=UPI00344073AF
MLRAEALIREASQPLPSDRQSVAVGVTPAYLNQFDEPSGYLDFARFGPVSADVSEVLVRAARTIRSQGHPALAAFEAEQARTVAAGAALLGAAPHEVALVSSTSHGMFAAAHALRGPGTVLVSRSDFPAAVYPWLRAAERGGLGVRELDGPVTADTVRARLDDGVRAVSVCAVDALTGFRTPLAEIKEVIGPRRVLVVDAVQALGAVETDADAADLLACGGQKWLRSGWGAALLLVRDRVAGLLEPGLGGWSGVHDPLGGLAHPRPALPGAVAHTFTNPDGPAVAALGAGLALVHRVGVGRIAARIAEALGSLLDAARSAGAEVAAPGGGGIGRLRLPGADPAAVQGQLAAAGLSTTQRGDWIRLAPHATTPRATAHRLAEALRAVRR